jgi:cobalt/nickel transport system permease protein
MIPEARSATTLVHRIDARLRVIQVASLALACAFLWRPASLWALLGVSVALCAAARIPLRVCLRRLIPLNAMLLLACAGLLLAPQPDPVRALGLVLKSNALLLALTALVGTLDPAALGDALERLRVPRAFTRLLLLCVRYVEVLRSEADRMQRAMRARGFRPGPNAHSLRTLGQLVGNLLVRALNRGERVAMAMRCRGYTGQFPALPPRRIRPLEWGLCAGTHLALAALLWGEWR